MAGRESKLTLELCHMVQDLLSQGLPDLDVCAFAGIGKTKFYEWIATGEKILEEAEKTDDTKVYMNSLNEHDLLKVEFVDSIKKGRAGFKSFHLGNINKKCKYDWKASAWALERRDHENFGDKSKAQVNVQHSGEITCKSFIDFLLEDDIPKEEDK